MRQKPAAVVSLLMLSSIFCFWILSDLPAPSSTWMVMYAATDTNAVVHASDSKGGILLDTDYRIIVDASDNAEISMPAHTQLSIPDALNLDGKHEKVEHISGCLNTYRCKALPWWGTDCTGHLQGLQPRAGQSVHAVVKKGMNDASNEVDKTEVKGHQPRT